MRTRMFTTVLAGLAAASLLAACSDETTGAPGTEPQPTQGQTSGLPHSGAPKVDNPIDTAKFEADPCSVITKQQLSGASIPVEETKPKPDGVAGPQCTWYPPFEWGQFTGAFLTANTAGLSVEYQKNDAGEWEFFEPLVVDGYPAVFSGPLDHRKDGKCAISVGARDDLAYHLLLQADQEGPYYKNPCAGAKKLAAMAIQTMKAG